MSIFRWVKNCTLWRRLYQAGDLRDCQRIRIGAVRSLPSLAAAMAFICSGPAYHQPLGRMEAILPEAFRREAVGAGGLDWDELRLGGGVYETG